MAAYKKSLTVLLFVTIILSMFCGNGEARKWLGYGAMGKDKIPACGSKNPSECIKNPVNHYYSGCEGFEHCRHVPPRV
ncbi:hypothetical protein EUTSA_v10023965mg [Eutrema salsugineum]|uniref:Uncharacterized protein n=1 Tax=Eutrema salsugineum TaxID=72664 RepID=V4KHQ9_EUTSA|nr:hypothetical protein EUTSA_v10023965mg [Eutrema salsugineum]